MKTVEGTDDFASMQEVVRRYFERRIADEKPLPDLIVVDGGKGQLSSAHAALTAVNLADRPLISIAKREEEIFVWGRAEPVSIPPVTRAQAAAAGARRGAPVRRHLQPEAPVNAHGDVGAPQGAGNRPREAAPAPQGVR